MKSEKKTSKKPQAGRRRLDELVGWFSRLFKRPKYFIGWDVGSSRSYWVKSRLLADGTLEVVSHGFTDNNKANANVSGPKGTLQILVRPEVRNEYEWTPEPENEV